MEATRKWNKFMDEELPQIERNLKSNQVSEARSALTKLFEIIKPTNHKLIFDTLKHKPQSNSLIPVEDNELLNWAKKVQELLGTLLTKVNDDIQNHKNTALEQAKLVDNFLKKEVVSLESDLIDNYGIKTALVQDKNLVPTFNDAINTINTSLSQKLLPKYFHKYQLINDFYEELIESDLPRLTCLLTYKPRNDQIPVKINQKTMLLLKKSTMSVLPTFSIWMKNNTMSIKKLETSDSIICGSMIKSGDIDKRCFKYLSKQVDPHNQELFQGLIPSTLDYNLQEQDPLKLNALRPLSLNNGEFIWFSPETAAAYIILEKQDKCTLEHYAQAYFTDYLNKHPTNKNQTANMDFVSEAFKLLPQNDKATNIAIRVPAELFCIQNLLNLFGEKDTEKIGKLRLPMNINSFDTIDYCDSYALSAIDWILSTFSTRSRETSLSKYCKHMNITRKQSTPNGETEIPDLKHFTGKKLELIATAACRIIDFNEHSRNRRTKLRNFDKVNQKMINFSNQSQKLPSFIADHQGLSIPAFWKNARTYILAAGTYTCSQTYMTVINNEIKTDSAPESHETLLEKIHILGGRQNMKDSLIEAIKFVAPEHKPLVDDTFINLLENERSCLEDTNVQKHLLSSDELRHMIRLIEFTTDASKEIIEQSDSQNNTHMDLLDQSVVAVELLDRASEALTKHFDQVPPKSKTLLQTIQASYNSLKQPLNWFSKINISSESANAEQNDEDSEMDETIIEDLTETQQLMNADNTDQNEDETVLYQADHDLLSEHDQPEFETLRPTVQNTHFQNQPLPNSVSTTPHFARKPANNLNSTAVNVNSDQTAPQTKFEIYNDPGTPANSIYTTPPVHPRVNALREKPKIPQKTNVQQPVIGPQFDTSDPKTAPFHFVGNAINQKDQANNNSTVNSSIMLEFIKMADRQAQQFNEFQKRAEEQAAFQAREAAKSEERAYLQSKLAAEIADRAQYRAEQQHLQQLKTEENYQLQNRQLQIHLANKLEQSQKASRDKEAREARRNRRRKEGKSNIDGPSSDEDEDADSTERVTLVNNSMPLTDEQKEENLKIDQLMNLGITMTREEAKVRIMRIKQTTENEDQGRELGGESTITSRHLKSIKSFDLGPISVDSDKNPAQFIEPFTDLRATKKEGGKILKKKTSTFSKTDLALIGIHPLAKSHSNIFAIRDKSTHYKELMKSCKNSFWRSNNSSFFKHAMETMHRIGNSIIRQHMNMTCNNPFLYLTTWHALVESLMTETEYSTWYMYYESLPQSQTKHMTLIEKISAIGEVIDQPAVSAQTVIASNLQQVNQNQQQNEPLEAYIRRWELNLLMAYGVTKDDYDTKMDDQTVGQCQIKFLGGLANRKFADYVTANLTDIKLKPSKSISMWYVPLKMFINRIILNDRQFASDPTRVHSNSSRGTVRATGSHTMQNKSTTERCPGCNDPKHSHCELVDIKNDTIAKIDQVMSSNSPAALKAEQKSNLWKAFNKTKKEMTQRKVYHPELENHEAHVEARKMNNQPLFKNKSRQDWVPRRNFNYNNRNPSNHTQNWHQGENRNGNNQQNQFYNQNRQNHQNQNNYRNNNHPRQNQVFNQAPIRFNSHQNTRQNNPRFYENNRNVTENHEYRKTPLLPNHGQSKNYNYGGRNNRGSADYALQKSTFSQNTDTYRNNHRNQNTNRFQSNNYQKQNRNQQVSRLNKPDTTSDRAEKPKSSSFSDPPSSLKNLAKDRTVRKLEQPTSLDDINSLTDSSGLTLTTAHSADPLSDTITGSRTIRSLTKDSDENRKTNHVASDSKQIHIDSRKSAGKIQLLMGHNHSRVLPAYEVLGNMKHHLVVTKGALTDDLKQQVTKTQENRPCYGIPFETSVDFNIPVHTELENPQKSKTIKTKIIGSIMATVTDFNHSTQPKTNQILPNEPKLATRYTTYEATIVDINFAAVFIPTSELHTFLDGPRNFYPSRIHLGVPNKRQPHCDLCRSPLAHVTEDCPIMNGRPEDPNCQSYCYICNDLAGHNHVYCPATDEQAWCPLCEDGDCHTASECPKPFTKTRYLKQNQVCNTISKTEQNKAEISEKNRTLNRTEMSQNDDSDQYTHDSSVELSNSYHELQELDDSCSMRNMSHFDFVTELENTTKSDESIRCSTPISRNLKHISVETSSFNTPHSNETNYSDLSELTLSNFDSSLGLTKLTVSTETLNNFTLNSDNATKIPSKNTTLKTNTQEPLIDGTNRSIAPRGVIKTTGIPSNIISKSAFIALHNKQTCQQLNLTERIHTLLDEAYSREELYSKLLNAPKTTMIIGNRYLKIRVAEDDLFLELVHSVLSTNTSCYLRDRRRRILIKASTNFVVFDESVPLLSENDPLITSWHSKNEKDVYNNIAIVLSVEDFVPSILNQESENLTVRPITESKSVCDSSKFTSTAMLSTLSQPIMTQNSYDSLNLNGVFAKQKLTRKRVVSTPEKMTKSAKNQFINATLDIYSRVDIIMKNETHKVRIVPPEIFDAFLEDYQKLNSPVWENDSDNQKPVKLQPSTLKIHLLFPDNRTDYSRQIEQTKTPKKNTIFKTLQKVDQLRDTFKQTTAKAKRAISNSKTIRAVRMANTTADRNILPAVPARFALTLLECITLIDTGNTAVNIVSEAFYKSQLVNLVKLDTHDNEAIMGVVAKRQPLGSFEARLIIQGTVLKPAKYYVLPGMKSAEHVILSQATFQDNFDSISFDYNSSIIEFTIKNNKNPNFTHTTRVPMMTEEQKQALSNSIELESVLDTNFFKPILETTAEVADNHTLMPNERKVVRLLSGNKLENLQHMAVVTKANIIDNENFAEDVWDEQIEQPAKDIIKTKHGSVKITQAIFQPNNEYVLIENLTNSPVEVEKGERLAKIEYITKATLDEVEKQEQKDAKCNSKTLH